MCWQAPSCAAAYLADSQEYQAESLSVAAGHWNCRNQSKSDVGPALLPAASTHSNKLLFFLICEIGKMKKIIHEL